MSSDGPRFNLSFLSPWNRGEEAKLKPWTQEDVKKFIASDPIHGPNFEKLQDAGMLLVPHPCLVLEKITYYQITMSGLSFYLITASREIVVVHDLWFFFLTEISAQLSSVVVLKWNESGRMSPYLDYE